MTLPANIPGGEEWFANMLADLQLDGVFTQQEIADAIGISKQHMSNLVNNRARPSVRVVNAICEYMGRLRVRDGIMLIDRLGRTGERRAEWHRAAARTHGWEV